ncbi:hypothetical protein BJ166DRAFT_47356 [Pestalotiopsis sp. NC0098]|nr:hypothetical protein BJ166DRAFT_47356 [Pestalotiopsis sp. NC0098]
MPIFLLYCCLAIQMVSNTGYLGGYDPKLKAAGCSTLGEVGSSNIGWELCRFRIYLLARCWPRTPEMGFLFSFLSQIKSSVCLGLFARPHVHQTCIGRIWLIQGPGRADQRALKELGDILDNLGFAEMYFMSAR